MFLFSIKVQEHHLEAGAGPRDLRKDACPCVAGVPYPSQYELGEALKQTT